MSIADKDRVVEGGTSLVGFEEWRASVQDICGRFHPEQELTELFSGWARRRQCLSFDALDVSCNVDRIERAALDVRRDQIEYFFLILQLDGSSTMLQSERAAELRSGDGVIIDSTRPSSFRYSLEGSRQISLHLPRKQLISYLGFEPQGGMKLDGAGGIGRMLFEYVGLNALGEDSATRSTFRELLVFDLVGAAFAPADASAIHSSVHAEKLFQRICAQIERNYRDPALKISDIAAETGISVRYIQKLFTQRNESFSHYLEQHRLNKAATLLRRRAFLPGKISISEVAACCGFGSLAQFSRSFSENMGMPPSAFAESPNDAQE